jgi:CRISPR-associated endonuclease Cas2
MSVLLVTYYLNKPEQDYSDLLKKIKSYPYSRLSESSYAIITDKRTQTIYEELKKYIDKNDNILIINLKMPYWGSAPQEVIDWLDKHLTQQP